MCCHLNKLLVFFSCLTMADIDRYYKQKLSCRVCLNQESLEAKYPLFLVLHSLPERMDEYRKSVRNLFLSLRQSLSI